ncbi:MAG: NERD domain-containing protein [Magnetococcales bacterium]|nr:NERD domain-containing protein [Magnetococcales bacterium]
MAVIIPSDISQLSLAGAHCSELDTLHQLKGTLPDLYTVYHSVHWSRESWQAGDVSRYGEIDFVVLGPDGAVVLIEQKNGPLEETDEGGLWKWYGAQRKNVGEQIRRSIDQVKAKFQQVHGKSNPLAVDYLIYCPDYRIKVANAVALDSSRVVDAKDRDQLAQRIQKLLPAYVSPWPIWRERVAAFFQQTFEVVPDIHAFIHNQERQFTRLSGGMLAFFANLEMEPYRLRVSTAAGSGKTHLAKYFFDHALSHGKRPLLLCFNRPLSEQIKAVVEEGGMVSTWYGFCDQFLQERGYQLDYQDMQQNRHYWNEVQDRVVEESVPDHWRFDTLIIDEGQDFVQDWLDIARLFLKDDPTADLIWIEDPLQNLMDRSAVQLPEATVRYHSLVNFRSPYTISEYIQRILQLPLIPANPLPGLGVGLSGYDVPEQQPDRVNRLLSRLVKQGFQRQDVVIITCRGFGNSVFSTMDQIGSHTLKRFTGQYDNMGQQLFSNGEILFDSIYRFKGQQAAAVILVDVAPTMAEGGVLTDKWQRLLYCGMTRATVRLELVVQQQLVTFFEAVPDSLPPLR